jgi:hypothetical protein
MKLVVSNGRDLRVHDISGPINHLVVADLPIKLHGHFLLKGEEARKLVRDLARGPDVAHDRKF